MLESIRRDIEESGVKTAARCRHQHAFVASIIQYKYNNKFSSDEHSHTQLYSVTYTIIQFHIHIHNYTCVTYTIIQSIMRSEMCSQHLTHPSTPDDRQHCSAVGGSVPCSRVSPQSWTLPARVGIQTHNLGLPQVSSPTLYPLGHDCHIILSILSAYAPGAVGSHRTAPGEQLGVRCLAQRHFSRGIEFNSCWPETRTRKL